MLRTKCAALKSFRMQTSSGVIWQENKQFIGNQSCSAPEDRSVVCDTERVRLTHRLVCLRWQTAAWSKVRTTRTLDGPPDIPSPILSPYLAPASPVALPPPGLARLHKTDYVSRLDHSYSPSCLSQGDLKPAYDRERGGRHPKQRS